MAEHERVMSSFDRESTAAEVAEGFDLSGRRIVITGGASGIGTETARVLAGAGADVTIAVRDVAAGNKAAAEIGPGVQVRPLDLAELDSVQAFADSWDGPIHVLVNNAGVMAMPETRTARGWEMQVATNHLGHFALATALLPALSAEGARVVSVSSRGHLLSDVHLDDLFFDRRPYDAWQAYGQSKTANILFAVAANQRWAGDGVLVNALHPGRIFTNLGRHLTDELIMAIAPAPGEPDIDPFKSIPQGAATSVFLATSPLVDGVGGRYFENCQEAEPNRPDIRNGVAAYALDKQRAQQLWDVSERLIGRR